MSNKVQEESPDPVMLIGEIGERLLALSVKFVNSYELKPGIDTESVYVGADYHLAFLRDDTVPKIGLYNFKTGREPVVVFGKDIYIPEFGCPRGTPYWLNIIKKAEDAYKRHVKQHKPLLLDE